MATADGAERATWFFLPDRELAYPRPEYWWMTSRPQGGDLGLVVHAQSLLRDLVVYADRLDPAAEVEQALVTLLPGESAEFTIHTRRDLDFEQLVTRPVLRSVGDLNAGATGGPPPRPTQRGTDTP